MEMKKELILNGNEIVSEESFHKAIGKFFEIEGFYGENLDALWDVLSTSRCISIIWIKHKNSEKNLGDYFYSIIDIFNDVSQLKNQFEFKLC